MADPVGLADLGLRTVKRALKHGSNIRDRRHDLEALAHALDQAHDALMSAKSSPDVSDAHEEILAPLIRETVIFFETVSTRKRFKSFAGKYFEPGRDSVAARRLLEAFTAAPDQIQARTRVESLERQVQLSHQHLQTFPQVLDDMREKQHTSPSHITRLILLCNFFFDTG